MVLGRGVDADQAEGLHLEAGLLAHLARERLADRLAGLDRAAREAPEVVVGAVLEEHALGAEDDGRDAGADHHRAPSYGDARGARKQRGVRRFRVCPDSGRRACGEGAAGRGGSRSPT